MSDLRLNIFDICFITTLDMSYNNIETCGHSFSCCFYFQIPPSSEHGFVRKSPRRTLTSKTICKYNQLVTDQPIQKENIEKGHFPRNESSSNTGIAFLHTVVPVSSILGY